MVAQGQTLSKEYSDAIKNAVTKLKGAFDHQSKTSSTTKAAVALDGANTDVPPAAMVFMEEFLVRFSPPLMEDCLLFQPEHQDVPGVDAKTTQNTIDQIGFIASKQDSTYTGIESNALPSVRYVVTGTTYIALGNPIELASLVSTARMVEQTGDNTYDLPTIMHCLQQLTPASCPSRVQAPSLHVGVVMPGDVLYIPPNVILVQKVVNDSGCGLRLSFPCLGSKLAFNTIFAQCTPTPVMEAIHLTIEHLDMWKVLMSTPHP